MRLNWKKIEHLFENTIWNFRFFVIIPVVCSLISSLKFFLIGTLDICAGVKLNFDFNDPEGETTYKIISYIIGGVDYYLIGIVLLIFGLGIYELFVSKIDIRFKDEDLNILQSESLEELKGKLVQVIVVALIVSLFKKMLGLELKNSIDLIYLSSSILLISISSYLLRIQHNNLE